ncbi:MAG: hypothetical protein ACXU8O_04290 [Asticcacaulis sp.]
MSIGSTNYPQPVQVNGFTCHNCTDVDYAKKHIDPAHPKSGPYGVNAATDPSNKTSFIQFGGVLSANSANSANAASQGQATPAQSAAPGQSVNILA